MNTYCQNNVNWHLGRNFSIDTIVAQFAHIDMIIDINCNVIKMETAAAFRAAVDRETFEKVQKLIEERAKKNLVGRKSEFYELTGMIK